MKKSDEFSARQNYGRLIEKVHARDLEIAKLKEDLKNSREATKRAIIKHIKNVDLNTVV